MISHNVYCGWIIQWTADLPVEKGMLWETSAAAMQVSTDERYCSDASV